MSTRQTPKTSAREKLLQAALQLIREKGFAAASVEALCARAGVTKGAFFHHFDSKEALGVAVAEFWAESTGALFAAAPYHRPPDPLDRIFAYIAFRKSLLDGPLPEMTCLAGTLVQEVYGDSPAIRDACAEAIFGHAATLIADIEAAKQARGIKAEWSAESLAAHTQAVLQGAFILAKAKNDPAIARESCDHLRRYIACLFGTAAEDSHPGNGLLMKGPAA